MNINENKLRQIIREAIASRLNEGKGYKLIDLIEDVCDEFNDQYGDKNLRSRPGKYNGRACIVVGGRGWDSVITGAFKTPVELQNKMQSIVDQQKTKAKSEEEALDPVVAATRCDGVIKVQIKEDGKMLDTPLQDSSPGNTARIEDYALYVVLMVDEVPKARR